MCGPIRSASPTLPASPTIPTAQTRRMATCWPPSTALSTPSSRRATTASRCFKPTALCHQCMTATGPSLPCRSSPLPRSPIRRPCRMLPTASDSCSAISTTTPTTRPVTRRSTASPTTTSAGRKTSSATRCSASPTTCACRTPTTGSASMRWSASTPPSACRSTAWSGHGRPGTTRISSPMTSR